MAWDISTRNKLPWVGLSIYGASTLTSMAGMSIGAACLAACLLLTPGVSDSLRRTWNELKQDSSIRYFFWTTLALAAAIILSWVAGTANPVVFNQIAVRPSWSSLAKLWYLAWPFVLAWAWKRTPSDKVSTVLRSWWWTFFVVSLFSIPEFFWGWPRRQGNPDLQPFNHPVLLLGHHLSVASVWIFPFFITLEGWTRKRFARIAPSWALIFSLVLSFLILILLYSRILWVALPVGLGAWALFSLPRRTAAGLLIGIITAVACATQLPTVQKRWNTHTGRSDRQQLWAAHWNIFTERPITGVGFGNPVEAVRQYFFEIRPDWPSHFVGHAHNLYLEALTGTGVLGLTALVLWILALFALILRSRRTTDSFATPIALACALIVFLINGLTQVNLWEGKVFHQVAWIAGWALSWKRTRTR